MSPVRTSPAGTSSAGTSSVGLVWFRRDLRLTGNPAWAAATSEHERVAALFVLDPRIQRSAGPCRNRQLVAELHALDGELRARGGRLLVHHGDPAKVVPRVARDHPIDAGPLEIGRHALVAARDDAVSQGA